MSECPVCHRDIEYSSYLPASEIPAARGKLLAHVECCSDEDLHHFLAHLAHDQIEFFERAMDLADNFEPSRVRVFEEKYGSYEEAVQGTPKDNTLTILALVSELKKRRLSH